MITNDVIFQHVVKVCQQDGESARRNHINRDDNPFSRIAPDMAEAWDQGWVAADEAIGG